MMVLLCALVLPAQAQKVRVHGVVSDEYSKPVEMAMVRAEGQTGIAICNMKGRYSLMCEVPKDSLVLVYSMIGHRTKKHVLNGVAGDSILVNITLSSTGVQLSNATVKAYRRQTDQMQKLSAKGAKLMPSTTGNAVEELVATQMGVSSRNEMSSQYNVRGGSFDENVVYINGQEIYRPMLVRSGQQEGLSIINSNMVSDISFSAGGFPAKYGDKMSSVLDITYKQPEKTEGSVALSLLGGDAYLGFGNKKFSMLNGLRYKTTRHLLGSTDTQGEYKPNFFDYQNFITWKPNDRWSLDFIGYLSTNHYNFRPKNRETKFGTMNDAKQFLVYFDGQEKDLFRTRYASLRLTHHFNEKTQLALLTSFYATKEQETYDIQGEYWLNEATTQEQLGVGTYMEHARNYLTAQVMNVGMQFHRQWGQHNVETAWMYKNEKVKENATEWEMRDSSDYSMPHRLDRLNLIYSLRAKTELSTNRFEYYLQDTYRWQSPQGRFTLNYGLRITHWSWNKETLFSPRVSLGWIPTFNENFTFRAATGVYYQSPFYKELRDTVTVDGNTHVELNKDIKSQRSIHLVIGGDYQFRMIDRPFRFSSEVYYKSLSQLIPYNVNNIRVVYCGENLGKGYVAGIDFKLFGEFVPGADSWVTLSLMSTKETILGHTIPRPTGQRYNLSLFFTDFFPGTTRWKMTLKAALADGFPFGVPHGKMDERPFRAPAYRRVDIGMSYRLLNNEDHHIKQGLGKAVKNAWLGVDAFNILGINNVNSYYWVTDITNHRFAIPNYLTGRLLNARLLLEF
ncbi:MAG: TonB-dependent receptor plug domain-containing protein [Bacteroidaceae bacterium]|nr:TonB-dependent receptor plug domain-containing protein [Bacteroidaceae bacterium]